MPLPLILGGLAAIAGTTGIGAGIYGAKKAYDAKETMDTARSKYERSTKQLEEQNVKTCEAMDKLGKFELEILSSFKNFSNLIEKIHNRPEFKNLNIGNVVIPKYNPEKLNEASVGAATLLGTLAGAGVGTIGGIAASGATTTAVMALGTASTGTAIASLSGVAATNATLAALGGGSIAAGGGGIALGTTILGASTLGVGLLVGGAIFAFSGSKMSDKADEAYNQAKEIEVKASKICSNLQSIFNSAVSYYNSLEKVASLYNKYLTKLYSIVMVQSEPNWNRFTEHEKLIVQNTIALVSVLYEMCKVEFVIDDKENDTRKVNCEKIKTAQEQAERVINNVQDLVHI